MTRLPLVAELVRDALVAAGYDLAPEAVRRARPTSRLMAWPRAIVAVALHDAGLNNRQIADAIGVRSVATAREAVFRGRHPKMNVFKVLSAGSRPRRLPRPGGTARPS